MSGSEKKDVSRYISVGVAIRRWLNIYKLNLFALLIIVAVVILGNFIYVSGLRDPNPLLQLSGLAVRADPRMIEGIDTIDPNNGFTSQTLGNLAADKILDGDMPYWNHYEGLGAPLAGGMQSAALSPFTLLLKFQNGLLIIHMLLEIFAGFFTYLFLRRLRLSWAASVAGGVAFALNGTFAWLTNAVFNPIAFLPMLMYGIERIYNGLNERVDWLYVALALALSLYAGFPETAFINGLLALLWAIMRLVQSENKKRYAIKLAMGGVIGLALAAPILVAFLGYLPYAYIGGHDGAFAHVSLGLISLPAHVYPYVYGAIAAASGFDATGTLATHWGSIGGFFTVTMLTMAVIGLFSDIDRRIRYLCIGWFVACLLKMFGFGAAEFLWNLIPTIENAAFFRYATPSMAFTLIILAAYGFDTASNSGVRRKRLAISFLAVAAILTILALIAKSELWRISSVPNYRVVALLSVTWGILVFIFVYVIPILIKKQFVKAMLLVLVAIDSILLFIIPQLSTPKIQIDIAPVKFIGENIDFNRYYTLSPIAPNYGSYYGIASVNQNNLPVPKTWSEYINKNLDRNTDPILFVGYFRADVEGPSAFEEFVANQDNFRYVGVKYLVTSKNQLTSEQAAQAELNKVFTNAGVDIYELARVTQYFEPSKNCKVIDSDSRDAVIVECVGDGDLLRKELWMPGWRATVNGQSVANEQKGEIFQGVAVTDGRNEVKFNYLPPFMEFAYVAFAGALAWIGYSMTPSVWRQKIYDYASNLFVKIKDKSKKK